MGLGNPGRKYDGTRHNVGFEVVRRLAAQAGAAKPRAKFDGEIVETSLANERIVLLAPQTYMNRSGGSVLAARDFYKLENESILIVCDDFALPLGRIRFRGKGSSGGQKGLGDVIQRLGSQEIPRLRIGIGLPPENWDVADYVLSKFRLDEMVEISNAIEHASNGVVDWIRHGTDYCMNLYNSN